MISSGAMTSDAEPHTGDCFIVAAGLVTAPALPKADVLRRLTDITLVHAVVVGNADERPTVANKRFWHAWVEGTMHVPIGRTGQTVPVIYAIDRSNGLDVITSRDRYLQIGRVDRELTFRYTIDQARDRLLETGNYGPWIPDYDSYVDV